MIEDFLYVKKCLRHLLSHVSTELRSGILCRRYKMWVEKICFFISFLLLCQCTPKPPIQPSEPQSIIFLGHFYQNADMMDPRLEKVNFREYDQVWLGGDVCTETTEDRGKMRYLDRHFDLGHEGTLWAVGNHDVRNGNLEWISEFTGRELSYFTKTKDLGILVLNTNWERDNCEKLEEQFQLIKSVTDTVETLSHLVIMTHFVVWGELIEGQNMWETANANKPSWQFRCEGRSDFQSLIYPMLESVQQRGVQVICLAGDFGQNVQKFEYLANSGIWFLGAGFNKGFSQELDSEDAVILFDYEPFSQSLEWDFLKVDEL